MVCSQNGTPAVPKVKMQKYFGCGERKNKIQRDLREDLEKKNTCGLRQAAKTTALIFFSSVVRNVFVSQPTIKRYFSGKPRHDTPLAFVCAKRYSAVLFVEVCASATAVQYERQQLSGALQGTAAVKSVNNDIRYQVYRTAILFVKRSKRAGAISEDAAVCTYNTCTILSAILRIRR